MNTLFPISILSSFVLTLLIIPPLRKVAIAINLVDKPNKRKVHVMPVPLVGGIAIFISTALSFGLVIPHNPEILHYKNIFFSSVILLIMGAIDDRFDLKASMKLVIQLVIAHYVFSLGIKLESLHGLFGVHEVDDQIQYILTIIIITGVINAYNLMDGIDGLAAGIALIAFVTFLIISILTNQKSIGLIFATNIGALLAFLRFNLSSKSKIFMGDAGSIMLGFILVVSSLYLLQNTSQLHNQSSLQVLAVLAVMLVPVFDALRVFRKRMKSGKSPFYADKTHLHHLLLGLGLKHRRATLHMIGIIITILIIGLISYKLGGITFSIISMVFIIFMVTSLLHFHNKLLKWKNAIKDSEIK